MLAGAFLFSTAASADDSFHGLGGVSFGGVLSAANGVSGNGKVVVGVRGNGTGFDAVRWTPAGMLPLGDLPGGGLLRGGERRSFRGRAIVGQSESGNGYEAFRWTMAHGHDRPGRPSGTRLLRQPRPPLPATAVSWSGSPSGRRTATGTTPGDGRRPRAWWTWATCPAAIRTASPTTYRPTASVVVGASSSSAGSEGFIWKAATGMVGIGDLPGGFFASSAEGVSADGTVVVGYGTGPAGSEAIRWTAAGGMVGLGDLPGGNFSSAATAVSADGNVIVGSGIDRERASRPSCGRRRSAWSA